MSIQKFLDPKNDFAFKKIFGTEKNKTILIRFINDILDFKKEKKIKDVTFLNTSQDPETESKKQSIVDVLCKDQRGRQYIVEMQIAHGKGFEKRAQYYAARAYSSQMHVGEKYENLKEIIFLAITDFEMFPGKPGYLSTHVTLDRETFTHDLKDFYFSFLELPKFNKDIKDLKSIVDKWAYFFKNAPTTTPEQLDEIAANDQIIKKAFEALDQFYWTEEEIKKYEQEMKRALDEQAILAQRFDQGVAQGIAEGVAQGVLQVALNLLKQAIPIQTIQTVTNLSSAELIQLQNQLSQPANKKKRRSS